MRNSINALTRSAWALIFLTSAAQADVWTFETPSQNIQCVVGHEQKFSDLTCTIIERAGAPATKKPANCNADWGHTFFMHNTGRSKIICMTTDTNKGSFERADYGVTGEFGGFICHSAKIGLRCQNRDGHGFFLSRGEQRIF